jgi:hypothetical protein
MALLPSKLQPSIFILLHLIYWLMLDNVTLALDLNAAKQSLLLRDESERTANKIAVTATLALAFAENARVKRTHVSENHRCHANATNQKKK